MNLQERLPQGSDADLSEEAAPNNILLWVVIFGFMLLFFPLYLLSSTINNDVAQLESEVAPLEAVLTASPPSSSAAQILIQTRDDIQSQVDQFTRVAPTLAANQTDWPAIVQIIDAYDPALLTLTTLEQTNNELRIGGRAQDDTVVVAYARALEASGLFNSVVVQSIVVVDEPFLSPTPTVTVAATATSASQATAAPTASPGATATRAPATATRTPQPTLSPTPDLRDAYESDDSPPPPIYQGQAQNRNFYPDFDVDSAVFLAKAGRIYRVQTTGLSPGVDTFLTVTYGETSLSNDDAAAGTLASTVQMQAPADRDVEVVVRVTNRGPYGADMRYQLLVEELAPTATPTTIPVTPATATPSPTATSTPTVTPSPTATPDLRDDYEPDEGSPAQIAIGETQTHNFYPLHDVDKVIFPIKNGRHYQVRTADLALGVDTALTVTVGSEVWANDDYGVPGSGNFASAVCFPAAADGTAVTTIRNVSPQYAPNKTYTISVQEAPELQVSPTALSYGPVAAGSTQPLTQTIQLNSAAALAWTASLVQPDETTPGWLSVSAGSGTAPGTLTLVANPTSLASGTYTATLTIGWATFCRQAVAVSLQVNPTGSVQPNVETVAQAQRDAAAKQAAAWSPAARMQSTAVEFVIVVELKP